MKQKVLIQFEPRQVVNLQMDSLLAFFNPNRIASAGLRDCAGILTIRFNHPSGDLHPLLIPDLRYFLRVLGRRWGVGSAPYFSEPGGDFLPLYFAAQLEQLHVLTFAAHHRLAVRHNPQELEALRRGALAGVEHIGRRALMPAGEIQSLQDEISGLFARAFRNPIHF